MNEFGRTPHQDPKSVIATLTRSLNPPQSLAANALEGPLLILAGAGSGKTKVLTVRTANLVAQGLASTDEILAVTFTNKAAREMENRIQALLKQIGSPVYGRMWISTFHSICARILREHIHLLDYKPFFGIYDSSDQVSMVKKVLTALGIDDKTHPAKGFAARINSAKTDALTPEDVKKRRHLMDDRSISVYEKYEHEMKRANSLDFGDLLMKTYQLFVDYPAVLEKYQNKFRYIMVDEYQDTNRIQYLLVQKLAQAHRNLCVVGDEDQSIYSWRGADINNILDFEKDFKDAKVVKLEQNYRSSQTIINAATKVIRNNTQRKDKTLFTENPEGDPIIIREENNEYDEARFVVGEVQKVLNEGEFTAKDVAIFYRT
ncbi:MAG: UvrD-helicase domain-containing protein, partial [Bdellovibrionota bacterium]